MQAREHTEFPRVWWTHDGLRSRWAGFDSRAGDRYRSSECAGFARDFAKVEDQVQFLARAWRMKSMVMRRLGMGEPSWL